MSAENALSSALFCIAERALRYLRGKAQPSGVETVKVASKPFAARIQFLHLQEDPLPHPADAVVVDGETVKLVAVDCQVPLAGVVPLIFLIHGNADQVGHDFREPAVVIAFHPHHFHALLGIGELADVPEKLPVFFRQAAEVEVGKDVAQQDQPLKIYRLEKLQRVACPADVGAQMQVGNDDSVKAVFPHAPFL